MGVFLWATPSSHSHNSPDVRLAYIKLVFQDAACKACLHVHVCAVPKVGKPYQRHGKPMLQKQAVWSPSASGKQFTSACVVIGTACVVIGTTSKNKFYQGRGTSTEPT